MPDIRLPDGRIIKNVPEGISKEDLTNKLIASGTLTGQEDFLQPKQDTQTEQPNQEPIRTQEEGLSLRSPEEQATFERLAPLREQTTREAGLGVRAIGQGIAAIPSFVGDIATLGINKAFGTDIQAPSQIVSEGLTAIGLPEPETARERIIGAGIEAGTGAGALVKGLKAVKGAPKLVQTLASGPVSREVGAGVGAGLASQTASEIGVESLPAKIAIGVGGGLAGGAAAARALRPRPTVAKQSLLSDVAESGIDDVTAFTKVEGALKKEATKQQKKISKLFTAAKEKGKEAVIASDDIAKLSDDLIKDIDDVIDVDGKSLLQSTSKTLADLSEGNISNTVNRLQSFRRQASKIVRKDLAGSEGAKKVLEKIDNFLENVEIQGDPQAVKTWKDAIKARREFGGKFENPKKIAKAINEEETIESIEREFIGTGPVASKKDLAKTYNETIRALPSKQRKDVAFSLRQSVVNRMIKTAAQASDSKDGISASRLSNQIRNLRRENKSFWDKFTPAEKKTLSKLEADLRKSSDKNGIQIAANALTRFVGRIRQIGLEAPRTLKPKTIVTVDDLLRMSSTNPKQGFMQKTTIPAAITTQQSITE